MLNTKYVVLNENEGTYGEFQSIEGLKSAIKSLHSDYKDDLEEYMTVFKVDRKVKISVNTVVSIDIEEPKVPLKPPVKVKPVKPTRRRFTTLQKMEIVKDYRSMSASKVAKKHGCSVASIYRWFWKGYRS